MQTWAHAHAHENNRTVGYRRESEVTTRFFYIGSSSLFLVIFSFSFFCLFFLCLFLFLSLSLSIRCINSNQSEYK